MAENFGATLTANIDSFVNAIKRGTESTDALSKAIENQGSLAKGLAAAFNPATVAIGAATAALTALVAVTTKASAAFAEAEKSQLRLEAIIRATGGAAGQSAGQVAQFADEMARVTLFDDDAIKDAASVMLTFKNVTGDTFKEAIKLSGDLAATFGGDLNGKAVMLGKALQEPIEGLSALRRVGVSFTESQQSLIKSLVESGDLLAAQGVILNELRSQVGGAAEAVAGGLAGAFHKLDYQMGETLEAFGGMVASTGALQTISEALATVFGGLEEAFKKATQGILGFRIQFNLFVGDTEEANKLMGELMRSLNMLGNGGGGGGAGGMAGLSKAAEDFKKKLEDIDREVRFNMSTYGLTPAQKDLEKFIQLLQDNEKAFNALGKEGQKAAERIKQGLRGLVELEAKKAGDDWFGKMLEIEQKHQEEIAQKLAAPFVKAGEEMQEAFARGISTGLEDGFSGLGSVLETAKKMIYKWIGEIAAALIFKPIIAPILTSAATSIAGQAAGQAVGSQFGLSAASSAASGGNGLFSTLSSAGSLISDFGGLATGASSLSSIGGFNAINTFGAEMLGTGLPGLAGSTTALTLSSIALPALAIAGIGYALFGGKSRPHPVSGFQGLLNDKGVLGVDPGAPGDMFRSEHMDTKFAQDLAGQFSQFTQALSGLGFGGFANNTILGGVYDGTGRITVADHDTNQVKEFEFDPENANEMSNAIAQASLAMADASGVINKDVREAFENLKVDSVTAEEALAAFNAALQKSADRAALLQAAAQEFQKLTNPNTAAALDALGQYYTQMQAAAALGADTQTIERLHQLKMQQIINGNLASLQKELKDNQSLIQLRQEDLQIAQAAQREWAGISDNLKKTIDSLKLSALSPLTPAQRYAEAQAQFTSTARAARLGDADAAKALPAAAQAFLTASRDFNAGSGAYTSDFEMVQHELNEAKKTADRQVDIQAGILENAKESLAALQAANEKLQKLIDSGGSSVNDAFAKQIAQAATGAFGAVKNFQEVLIRALGFHGTAFGGGAGQAFVDASGNRGRLNQLLAYFGVNAYASGGIPTPSMPAMVGERGAEMFIPSQSGRIASSAETASMVGANLGGARVVSLLGKIAGGIDALAAQQRQQNDAIRKLQAAGGAGRR